MYVIANFRDLSNNSLAGLVPDFLSQLQYLRVLQVIWIFRLILQSSWLQKEENHCHSILADI